ncbi:MAG: glycosyltransferase family 87 protein [Paraburkholderia sp.]|uniref:glycosyltransferase family 87 protein n=1 Tax=Paraburkholderia sp. TaxID=1926495 RepID=UPI003C477338
MEFYALAALALQCLVLTVWSVRYYVLRESSAPMVGIDFAVFWSAARVALEHGAASVFSASWMQPIEATVRSAAGFSPWPYPPTFLLAVLPFGLLPFGWAFALFTMLGVVAYGAVIARLSRGIERSTVVAMAAFPGAALAIYAGQNSLLTAAAAGGALVLLESRSKLELESNPLFAGACIAILAIKPQFGVLFPLALICGRQWKALIASAAFSIAFVAVSVAALGFEAWVAFIWYLPEFDRLALQHGNGLWHGMPTVFAAARLAGLSIHASYAVHAAVAIPAVVFSAYLWIKEARFELRAAALTIATMLVQPYMMSYDLAWLALPIAFLIRDAKARELSRAEWATLGIAWLMPAQAFFAGVFQLPCQLAPAALVALLAMTARRQFGLAKSRTGR